MGTERPTQQKVLLRTKELTQNYRHKGGRKKEIVSANDHISLCIYEGETLGLVGESGCGKSTFGKSLLYLYPPSKGEVFYYGQTLEEFLPRYQEQEYRCFNKRVQEWRKQKKENDSCGTGEKENLGYKVNETTKELAKTYGGWIICEEPERVQALLLKRWRLLYKVKRAKKKKKCIEMKLHHVEALLQKQQEQLKQQSEYELYEAYREKGICLGWLTAKELARLRKELQFIFQDPYSALNPRKMVEEIVSEGVKHHGCCEGGKALQDYVVNILTMCGISKEQLNRYPHQFSGGQRQRICIARSLALGPRFVVCDEAVSALDVSIQAQILNLLMDLKESHKLTYLFISHDLRVVRFISDRIGVMYLGKLVELATTKELFKHPIHPYTKALLSAIPEYLEEKQDNIELVGEIPNPMNPPSGCRFHTRCPYAIERCWQEEPLFVEIGRNHFIACHYAKELSEDVEFET